MSVNRISFIMSVTDSNPLTAFSYGYYIFPIYTYLQCRNGHCFMSDYGLLFWFYQPLTTFEQWYAHKCEVSKKLAYKEKAEKKDSLLQC